MSERAPRVEVGRVMGPHALRGELRVRYFGDGPDTLLDAEEVWLSGARADDELVRCRVVSAGTGRPGEVRLALEGVDDRDAAQALRGRLVLVDAVALAPLGDDEFYWHELVGCRVSTEEGEEIGTVRELWDVGHQDLLVVTGAGGSDILIPTVREIMTRVDLRARTIVVAAPPGLIRPAPGGSGEEGAP